MAIRVADQLVERVTEDQGKIVVTTTITLDKSALESGGGVSDPHPLASVPLAAAEGRMGSGGMAVGDMTVVPVNDKTYLCFVNNNRRRPRPLCIDDNLFIFVSRKHSLADMAQLVADLVQQLPVDTKLPGNDRGRRAEEILRAISSHQLAEQNF